MATQKGVWGLQQVRDKQLQSLWDYSASGDLGTLWSWGYNYYGAGGVNSAHPVNYSSPVQIPGTTWASDTTFPNGASALNSTWIKGDGTLWAWGNNSPGALGQNNRTQYSSPVQIPGTTWSKTTLSYWIQYGIKTDGTLWSWGYNTTGNLGLNDRNYRSSPAQIPGTTWKEVRGEGEGNYSTLAVKTDGTLWSWGLNEYGQLGLNQGSPGRCSSPTQIPGTTWDKIGAGYNKYYAIKTDGTLWAWGYGHIGALGDNSQTQRSSPVQIGSDTTWRSITAGHYTALATKTDGTLWAWGYNYYGTCGQGTGGPSGYYDYSSPIQIGSDTNWSTKVWGAEWSAAAIKTDGTLWTWGNNKYGSLGHNQADNVNYSSPVQIPGNWIDGNFSEQQATFMKSL